MRWAPSSDPTLYQARARRSLREFVLGLPPWFGRQGCHVGFWRLVDIALCVGKRSMTGERLHVAKTATRCRDLPRPIRDRGASCASSHHLVRVLGPIVFARSLLVVAGEPEVVEGSAVGAQLIGDHHLRREGLLSQQLAHKLDGRALVPPALNQYFEDLAFVVHRAPQVHPL